MKNARLNPTGTLSTIRAVSDIGKTVYINRICRQLRDIFRHDRWFISGSFANSRIHSPKDIDVYFYKEDDFKSAEHNIKLQKIVWFTQKTQHTTTFTLRGHQLPIQLIHKQFGSPDEIFMAMDINVCRQAILPDGRRIQARGSRLPIHLCNPNAESFSRWLKYHRYYKTKPEDVATGMRQIIDKYIHDGSKTEGYYNGENVTVNHALYRSFAKALRTYTIANAQYDKIYTPVYDYLIEQVDEHAPELLL